MSTKQKKRDKKKELEAHRRELKRVRVRIEDLVLQYCRANEGQVISGERLDGYVRYNAPYPVTPGSATRILRLLRQANKVDYEIVNRRKALYLIHHVQD